MHEVRKVATKAMSVNGRTFPVKTAKADMGKPIL
jgi:hypothetical protein